AGGRGGRGVRRADPAVVPDHGGRVPAAGAGAGAAAGRAVRPPGPGMTAPPLIPRAPARVFGTAGVILAALPALALSLYTHNLLPRAYILIAGALAWN